MTDADESIVFEKPTNLFTLSPEAWDDTALVAAFDHEMQQYQTSHGGHPPQPTPNLQDSDDEGEVKAFDQSLVDLPKLEMNSNKSKKKKLRAKKIPQREKPTKRDEQNAEAKSAAESLRQQQQQQQPQPAGYYPAPTGTQAPPWHPYHHPYQPHPYAATPYGPAPYPNSPHFSYPPHMAYPPYPPHHPYTTAQASPYHQSLPQAPPTFQPPVASSYHGIVPNGHLRDQPPQQQLTPLDTETERHLSGWMKGLAITDELKEETSRESALSELLISWYYSGYYTGRYQALQEMKKSKQ